MTGAGHTNTAAMAFGGASPPISANTELWNGTSWTETTNMSTGREYLAGAGTPTSALAFGGQPASPNGTLTEEWTAPTTSTVTFANS